MPIFKIRNANSGRYLDSNAVTLAGLNTSPNATSRPSVTVDVNNNSISQVWYSDSLYGQAYISSCLDRNFCITRYELSITHQCAMTVEKYYSFHRNCFDPKIQYVAASNGAYRIRLVGSNMYLTEAQQSNGNSVALWFGLTESDSQLWTFPSASGYSVHTLEIYQNMNQKYSSNNDINFFNDGCAASSAANASAYYGKTFYPYSKIIENNGFDASDGVHWNNYDYCKFGSDDMTPTFAKIKQNIDALNPVIIRMQGESGQKHYVMAYGYKGNCSSASDVFVLDSANSSNSSQDIGLFHTLADSYVINSCNSMKFLKTTSAK